MTAPESSLLAEVALRLARSPEDVATESLAYVLRRSAPARALMQHFAQEWAPLPLRHIAAFRSQVTGTDEARPDLEGQDPDGVPVLIFENKFWAGLTDAQPISYLLRLEQTGGVLCFVAPAARIPFLWPEIADRSREAFGPLRLLRDEPHLKVAHVKANRALALVSWGFILGQIRTVLEANGDVALTADVQQLIGLAARMETNGFLPFTLADLTAPTARHVLQFCEIVDATMDRLLRDAPVSKKGLRASGSAGWYGHYFRVHGYYCLLAFDASMWAQHGRSPVWLRVTSDWGYSDGVERALSAHPAAGLCVPVRDGDNAGVWVPLRIPEGRELEAVVEQIQSQVIAIANSLPRDDVTSKAAEGPPGGPERLT